MRRRHTDERGFTLVELLVVLVLFGAVGTVVTNAVITGLRAASEATARTQAIHELELSLERIGRELRAADPLYISGSDPRRYDEQLGAEVVRDRKIHVLGYQVVEGPDGAEELVQEVTVFDLDEMIDDPDAEPVEHPRRTLITTVDNDAEEPVFRYYDSSGAEIACDPDTEGETVCDGRYASAKEVSVRLTRKLENGDPITVGTRISIRNTRYGGGSE